MVVAVKQTKTSKSQPKSKPKSVIPAEQTLRYVERGLRRMLMTRGTDPETGEKFVGGFNPNLPFRPTQKEGLQALVDRISDDRIPIDKRRIGYYEHATGLGKTALFSADLQAAYSEAARDGLDKDLISYVVVPTTVLLHQTKEEIEEYAPYLKRPGMIGVYGDGKKELGRPVTIITYDSWVDLVESGQIDPATINIHIADEAHKNTSDRREDITRLMHEGEDHPDADSPQALCLAVTATSRYDYEKTVERSYKNKIHEKTMMQGVHSGELCDFIRTQNFVIRVDSGSKQEAWKKFAIEHFATGKDAESGKNLRDIVSAFYVDGTDFADGVAKGLNEHPDLARLAKERGMKGVAVAIHSKMSKGEQKRRMRDYMGYKDEKGVYHPPKYMAVVGDEKFKAGWNHPPLKCIFDYPRGSLVDKAQIEGRGSRRYIDPKTGKPTGLVLVDTILYYGDKDPEQNEKNRQRAIAEAVTFNQVTEGQAAIYREGRKPNDIEIDDIERERDWGGWGKQHGVGKVESYVSLEEIRTFDRETAKAVAALEVVRQRDVVTDDEHKQLLELMQEKKLAAKAIFGLVPSELVIETHLSIGKLSNCRTKGIKLERRAWEAVVEVLQKQLTPISEKEHNQLQALMRQKDLGSAAIMKIIPTDQAKIVGLNRDKIEACKYKTRLSRAAWDLVVMALHNQPDPISDKEHKELLDLMQKKDMGGISLMKLILSEEAKKVDLTWYKIDLCKSQDIHLSRPAWELVVATLRAQPDPITDLELQDLLALMKQKDLGGAAIIKLIPSEKVKALKLKWQQIDACKVRRAKISRPKYEIIMQVLQGQPDPITAADKAQLTSLLNKNKGLGGKGIMKLISPEQAKKAGLNAGKIQNFKSSQTILPRPAWELVVRTLEGLLEQNSKKENQIKTARSNRNR